MTRSKPTNRLPACDKQGQKLPAQFAEDICFAVGITMTLKPKAGKHEKSSREDYDFHFSRFIRIAAGEQTESLQSNEKTK